MFVFLIVYLKFKDETATFASKASLNKTQTAMARDEARAQMRKAFFLVTFYSKRAHTKGGPNEERDSWP